MLILTQISGFGSGRIGIGGNDSFTKVLLHGDGTDASTTITDSNAGGAAKTWTANGNAQIDTAQSKFGGGAILFDGTGDYVSTPDHADFTLGSGDFTVDFWFKRAANGNHRLCGQVNAAGDNTAISINCGFDASNLPFVAVYTSSTEKKATSAAAITDTSWHHFAGVRSGNTLTLFIDGTSVATVDVTGVTVNDSAETFSVGRLGAFDGVYFNGHIDEFRLSVGVARWTANFTPPTMNYS